MRKKFLLISITIVVVLISASSLVAFRLYNTDDDGGKDQVLGKVINQVLKMGHYKVLGEDYSNDMYNIYIKKLDRGKRFFLKKDIDSFNQYKKVLASEINNANYNFFKLSIIILEQRMSESKKMCEEILKKPFNFKKNEHFETDPDKQNFPKNEKEKYKKWHALLKYQAMIKLDRLLKIQENAIKNKDTSYVKKTYKELEEKARKELADDYVDVFKRYAQINHTDWLSTYLNSYIECYDPHSQYMTPKTKEDFDIGMSGKLEGIGATLTAKQGYVTVVKIVPGSPSWKQGELKAEDKILRVAQGDSAAVNIVDMRLDEAVKLIRGKKGTVVKLTVQKPDNTIVVIPIVRDEVILEETFAKSAILQIDGSTKRYGYIYLPSFYIDFRHIKKGRNCAGDVKKELQKLKKEQVDGIIFDLRNNSGGSLHEVVKIAGLFIKDGPIVQVSSRMHKPNILKDKDSRIQYDGDLVVLVNHFSASASEIFAAAMQDYKRAVIVGSKNTHGKGTVQNILSLDKILPSKFDNIKPLGALKMTIQKFYRVNGGATQLKGVIPDVILPDIYDSFDASESTLTNALKWDEIDSVKYQAWPLPVLNMTEIKQHSKARVDTNKVFQSIIKNTKRLKEEREKTLTSLNLKKYREEQEKLSAKSKQFNKDLKTKTSTKSFMLQEDLQYFNAIMEQALAEKEQVDSSKFISREHWIEGLQKDIYVSESLKILQEME